VKKIFALLFTALSLGYSAQTHQNINKTTGTVSNPITEIDSIRFDVTTNQMVVVTNNGNESHSLIDLVNVTFSSSSISGCGGITTVMDIDGNLYPIVQIGNQCWTKENLRTTKYNNGSVIQNVTVDSVWGILTPTWCNYNNDSANDTIYGKLYNWYAVSAGNMCPTGWHVPSDAEWTILTDYLGGATVAGGKLKSVTGWNPPNTAATNESGFSALPAGYRFAYFGFDGVGDYGDFWSSSESSAVDAWGLYLNYNHGNTNRGADDKRIGFPVRCLKD
jgi:uncharacterized protein (TIGR02145 family)